MSGAETERGVGGVYAVEERLGECERGEGVASSLQDEKKKPFGKSSPCAKPIVKGECTQPHQKEQSPRKTSERERYVRDRQEGRGKKDRQKTPDRRLAMGGGTKKQKEGRDVWM